MSGLRVIHTEWRHRLAVALRFDDHFLRAPVVTRLEVSLDGSSASPVPAAGGSPRHADGTYRFLDLPAGRSYPLVVGIPDGTLVSLVPLPTIVIPAVPPTTATAIDLWPTPQAAVTPGMTAIRGKLVGSGVADHKVEITAAGKPFTGRFTVADAAGEFLYLLPQALARDVTDPDLVRLAIRVTPPAGPVRVVTGGQNLDMNPPATFAGDQWKVVPSRASRVKFNV